MQADLGPYPEPHRYCPKICAEISSLFSQALSGFLEDWCGKGIEVPTLQKFQQSVIEKVRSAKHVFLSEACVWSDICRFEAQFRC